MESASNGWSHKGSRTTQHYAKIVYRKISDDMTNAEREVRNKEFVKSSDTWCG